MKTTKSALGTTLLLLAAMTATTGSAAAQGVESGARPRSGLG